jgi:2-polyprenyl-3-methyl-5-hydroxy-6-metoxy-1,4-benzoquinol methylase
VSFPRHKEYPTELEPGTSHAHAVDLLAERELAPGVVLDVGCGNAPLAGAVAGLGHSYVGLDVDRRALNGLEARGIEAHRFDLGRVAKTLVANLREILDGRPLRAVLALDVLGHLADPRAVVDALATAAGHHPGCLLVVSIPNVTHVEVGIRLLLGQWHMTEFGLLDDTHLRFFSHDGVRALMAGSGWQETGARDTIAVRTEQYDLGASAALQAHAPLSQFLRSVRAAAGPHHETYQFVRRYELTEADEPSGVDPSADGSRPTPAGPPPLLTAVVRVDTDADVAGLPPLLDDLAGQDDGDLEVRVVVTDGNPWSTDVVGRAERAAGVASVRSVPPGVDNRNLGAHDALGRYLWFLDGRARVGPGAVAAFRRGMRAPGDPLATDAVVRIEAAERRPTDDAEVRDQPIEAVLADAAPVEPDGFDLLRPHPSATALAAYALPTHLVHGLGVAVDAGVGEAATTDLVARAVEMAGLRGVAGVQVVVDPLDARDGALDAAPLRDSLSRRPFLLARGGVARLVQQRASLRRFERRLVEREAEIARLEAEVVRLEATVDDVRGERDRAIGQLEGVLAHPVVAVLRRGKRLLERLRRRLGRGR